MVEKRRIAEAQRKREQRKTRPPFHEEFFSATKWFFERQNGFSDKKTWLMGFSVKSPVS